MSQLSDSNRKQLYEDIRSAESLAPKIASPSLLPGSRVFTHHQAPKQQVKHYSPITPLTTTRSSKETRTSGNFQGLPLPSPPVPQGGSGNAAAPEGTSRCLPASSKFVPKPARAASGWRAQAARRCRSGDTFQPSPAHRPREGGATCRRQREGAGGRRRVSRESGVSRGREAAAGRRRGREGARGGRAPVGARAARSPQRRCRRSRWSFKAGQTGLGQQGPI